MSNIDENYYYEVINGTRQYGKSYVTNMIKERDKQIDQLTNNWNELEEWLEKQRIRNSEWEKFVQKDARLGIPIGYLLDKMQEIKEGNK